MSVQPSAHRSQGKDEVDVGLSLTAKGDVQIGARTHDREERVRSGLPREGGATSLEGGESGK